MGDDIGVFIRGLVQGLAIAAPVGPIGLLCIRRTVQRGFVAGFSTGFGAALADGFLGAITAFGITSLIDLLKGHEQALRLIGGVFLLAAGIHALLKEPHEAARRGDEPHNILGAVGSGLFLTLTNPITVTGAIALMVSLAGGIDRTHAGTLTLGVFSGSLLWWFLLSGGTYAIRHHLTSRTVLWLNRGTGAVLCALGVFALLAFFHLIPATLQGLLTDVVSK